MSTSRFALAALLPVLYLASTAVTQDKKAEKPAAMAKAFVDGTGLGWKALGEADFVNVNCDDTTWKWKSDLFTCTGLPVGVCRTQKEYTNFELVLEWRHNKRSGNSGVFVWTPPGALKGLKKGSLPSGIEVQVLDHGYTEDYEKGGKRKATWFTTNGDVFPVGKTKMTPLGKKSPDGVRSFPRKDLTKGFGEWNHYYIRAINGEVRLWTNGEEVSGGKDIEPRTGYVCLESEGSPIDFRNIAIRELP